MRRKRLASPPAPTVDPMRFIKAVNRSIVRNLGGTNEVHSFYPRKQFKGPIPPNRGALAFGGLLNSRHESTIRRKRDRFVDARIKSRGAYDADSFAPSARERKIWAANSEQERSAVRSEIQGDCRLVLKNDRRPHGDRGRRCASAAATGDDKDRQDKRRSGPHTALSSHNRGTIVRLLDPHTINQIAAGEVVERPASVVKELVENALDAGARRIVVELIDSGKTLVRVADDGRGMSPEDAEAAFLRHATSKIVQADDLRRIATLGFRGEAIPSIASVSRLTLTTATEDGLRVARRVEYGEPRLMDPGPGPRGTEIRVEDLFRNVPARLKFLKSDTTELGQCVDGVTRYAMAYPGVAFELIHNGHLVLRTSGAGDLHAALVEVWGRDLGRTLVPIEHSIGRLRLAGYVSPPHVTKPTRSFQHVFVNGRPVRTRTLTAAIDQAFRDLTPDRRFPLLCLLMEVDPEVVDVNVSPTKSEVRFSREGEVFDAVRIALRSALTEHGMMPDAERIAAVNAVLRGAWTAPTVEDFRLQPPPSDVSRLPGTTVFETETVPVIAEAPGPEWAAPHPEGGLDLARTPFAYLLDGLRVIGQAMNTFIVAETRHGVVLIDQHVAHERVCYEWLCGVRGAGRVEKQPLLVPQTLELDKRSAVLLRDRLDDLREVGFDIEPFGGDGYVVRSAPAALRGRDPVRTLREMIDELVELSVTRRIVPTREQIWITTSCKMAVKAGDPLSKPEMEKLVQDLALTENPYLCPHGRPITVTLDRDALLRLFKRS